jgi:UDP-N-acetylenolpyruvoylglucosamine reductase
MENRYKLFVDTVGLDKVKVDEPLDNFTALKSEGKAKLFFVAFTTQEIIRLNQIAHDLDIPVFVFGSGSKIIISQSGFEGLVIKNRTQNISVVGVKGKVSRDGIGVAEAMIEVEAGVSINKLVDFLNKQGLESSEITELPGTIGGNLFLSLPLQRRVQGIKVIEDGELEEIKVGDLRLQKQIILSAVFKFKAK